MSDNGRIIPDDAAAMVIREGADGCLDVTVVFPEGTKPTGDIADHVHAVLAAVTYLRGDRGES